MRVIIRIFLNIPTASTSTSVPASQSTSRGVTKGAKRVDTVVIPTEKATSPLQRKLMILLDTPPGQHPTRIMPVARYGLSPKTRVKAHATSGIMEYCATAPIQMSMGRLISTLKSSRVSVQPIVSIMMPKITLARPSCCTQPNVAGIRSDHNATPITNHDA